jgi:glycosyltransferase involved in cell wall biosynthesis
VIKRLLLDKELRNRLGINARKYAEKNFWTWNERIEKEIEEVTKICRKQ